MYNSEDILKTIVYIKNSQPFLSYPVKCGAVPQIFGDRVKFSPTSILTEPRRYGPFITHQIIYYSWHYCDTLRDLYLYMEPGYVVFSLNGPYMNCGVLLENIKNIELYLIWSPEVYEKLIF